MQCGVASTKFWTVSSSDSQQYLRAHLTVVHEDAKIIILSVFLFWVGVVFGSGLLKKERGDLKNPRYPQPN